MDVKPGQVVHCRGIVAPGRVYAGGAQDDLRIVAVNFGRDCPAVWISVRDIAHVEPATLNVGDSVTRIQASDETIYKIIALNFGTAWIRRGDFQHLISEAMLRRVEE